MVGKDETTISTEQRRLLGTAVEAGYFRVPRRVTLEELGERLGMSDVEASRALRRTLETHLRGTLEGFDPP